MTECGFCGHEMASGESCTLSALHQHGRHIPLPPHGDEPGWRGSAEQCGDCGVHKGGFHHPGCDLQDCPVCGRQLLSCGCRFDEDGPDDDEFDDDEDGDFVGLDDFDREPFGVDGNGLLTERRWINGQEVILHYDDIPESDTTVVRGIPCTTPVRTMIDLAPDVEEDELVHIVRDALSRRLFTVGEAWQRLRQPDMANRGGAEILRRVLRLMEPNHPDAGRVRPVRRV